MATAAKPKVFNYELFRKRVRMFDSTMDGERNVAMNQAIRQCRECEPPMHFWEAASIAFGNADHEGLERLEQRVETAEAEAKNQRQAAARSAEEARFEREIGNRLKQENAKLEDDLERIAQEVHGRLWLEMAVLQPKVLLLAVGIVVGLEWVAITPLGKSWLEDNAPVVAEWLHTVAIALFVLWSIARRKSSGIGELVSDWAVWGMGWGLIVGWLVWRNTSFDVGTVGFKQVIVPYRWWGTMGMDFSTGDCLVVLFILVLAVDINLDMPLMRRLLTLIEEGIERWDHRR